jgi:hypothetical protein
MSCWVLGTAPNGLPRRACRPNVLIAARQLSNDATKSMLLWPAADQAVVARPPSTGMTAPQTKPLALEAR